MPAAFQVVQLLVLWAVFLIFQMVKSKYNHCTKEYLVLFLAQTVFCISVTTFFMRRELADLGKPAAEQHRDPEMHQLLLGQQNGGSEGTICHARLCVCVHVAFAESSQPSL